MTIKVYKLHKLLQLVYCFFNAILASLPLMTPLRWNLTKLTEAVKKQ